MNESAQSQPVAVRPDVWTAAVRRAWQSAGLRITEPRERVLAAIVRFRTPFSAEQLYAELPETGRATVYRTLEQLHTTGWVARIHAQGGEDGYVASYPGHMHHLVCTNCGAVVIFEGCVVDALVDELARQTSFAIEGHLLQLYGRCERCR
ncbi:MAG: transcriptional repressor [Oscillochloris sp.]|nr:transcriptional repressor [Oscillochloris sp.]